MHLHICDDHPLIIKSIASLFEGQSQFSKISNSSTKLELLTALHNKAPDILILDVNLNGVNMLDELKTIKELAPKTKVIILTSYDSETFLRKAIKNGVHAYLNKNTDASELKAAIESVTTNELYIGNGKTKQFNHKDSFELIEELSEREKEVIQCLVEGNPNKKIADYLNISITTVQTHRRNIYRKLNLQGIGDLMSFAAKHKLY